MRSYVTRGLMAGAVLLFLLSQSIFVVNQTEQVLVLQFGDIRRVLQEPGLKFKIPFVQNVVRFDKRLLMLDINPEEVNATDEKLNITERLVIDAYAVYRITDPLKFYQAVRNEYGLRDLLGSIFKASLRRTVGSVSLRDLLSKQRTAIMEQIRDEINRKAAGRAVDTGEDSTVKGGFGIEVVDVRIMRADLPQEVSQSTFERMRSDFEKEAQKFRAEGEEKSLEIRSNAERERTVLIAAAQKEAEILRGEGEAIATRTYAESFGKDPEFFDFYRSMQAYRKALGEGGESTLILSPDSEFLKHMEGK